MFMQSRKTEVTYLIGAWPSKGSIKDKDSGQDKAYDSTKVRLMQLDRVGGQHRALGYADHAWGDSTNFDKIKHLDPTKVGPIAVEIVYESENKKSKTQDGRSMDVEVKKIIELRPIERLDTGAAKKAA